MGDTDSPGSAAPRAWWRLTREFLRDLFDVQFRTFMATRMLPGVYGFGIVLAALFTIYVVVLRFRESTWEGLAWLLLGPLMFLGLVTALRITLEFVLAVFRMAWYVEHVAGRTQIIADELPRFGFLRTLLFGEKSAPPAPRAGDPRRPEPPP
jgi:hypothetical protein